MTDRYGHPRQSVFQHGRRHASATASVAYSTSQHPQPTQAPHPPAAPIKPSRAHLQFRSQLTTRRLAPRGLDGTVDADGDTLVVDEDDEDDRRRGDLGDDHNEDDEQGIVVRDENGEYELEEPPSMVVDDPEEIVLDMRQENEKERQKLADAVKQHQCQQNSVPAQPEELIEAVRASLRAKVAALAEDKWMFEKEEELRLV